MAIEYETGEVVDHIGCLKASEHHELVVYENRGQDLSFLKTPKDATKPQNTGDQQPSSTSNATSGSERLQQRTANAEAETTQKRKATKEKDSHQRKQIGAFIEVLDKAAKRISGRLKKSKKDEETANRQVTAVETFFRESPTSKSEKPEPKTRADKGQVTPPNLREATSPRDHMQNAFLEFLAVIRGTQKVSLMTCESIMQSYKYGNQGLLRVRIEEADAAIYNNNTCEVLHGQMDGKYMAAYNATEGFVAQDEEETQREGKPKFRTPTNDPIVITARCTKTMLDDKILDRAKTVSESWEQWTVPKITWVNGVPGCGKSTWVVSQFKIGQDTLITTTCEAAKDLKEKLAHRVGAEANKSVRTMASVLVNGVKEPTHRLIVDEALMNHFGAIVMAARLSQASEIVLIGDVNQLPYIERENLFPIKYHRPTSVATISQELLCTHRNPMDVAYALSEVYNGMFASKEKVRSLQIKRYTGERLPADLPNTLFLVHTQAEKETLSNEGYGQGENSRILTVHEAQGLTYPHVIIVQTKPDKLQLHESVSHAVVAISRHTESCTYYTDNSDDAIGRFIKRALAADENTILGENLKMAIKCRNTAVILKIESLIRRKQT